MIVAQTILGGIGNNNQLPWGKPIAEDMRWFRKYTLYKTILMGRNTYESMPYPLKDRQCIVLTNDPNYKIEHENYTVVNNVDDIITQYCNTGDELVIIGGEQIYRLFLPYISRLYLTVVKNEYECDNYFPMIELSFLKSFETVLSKSIIDEATNLELLFFVLDMEDENLIR